MNIWIPKFKIIEPKRSIDAAIGLAGRFKLEAVRPDGRRRLLADWFPNLITNAGLNAIGNTSLNYIIACRVGSGSNTPNVNDTALQTFVAGNSSIASTDQGAQVSAPYFGTFTRTYRFNAGVAAGNLTEIGIATQSAVGGTLFSRALILDGDGDPTTVTVLSDEVLDATYQLQCQAPASDVVSTIAISGITFDTTLRASVVTDINTWAQASPGGPSDIRAYSGTIGAVTSQPAGSSSATSSNTLASYSADSYLRELTATWDLGAANFATTGIRALHFGLGQNSGGGLGRMQISLSKVGDAGTGILKTSSSVLSLVFRNTWARGTAI